MGFSVLLKATMILLILVFRSASLVAKQNIAINSLATVMSKPLLYFILFFPPIVTSISLKLLSFTSITLLQIIFSGFIFNEFPQ
jgi:hypothetical protein